jgi:hypothetical protein
MNEILGYRVNSELKNEYDEFITEKYGQKLGTAGTKMENAMKLYLTLEGNEKYQDDPDVKAMLSKVDAKSDHTHTKSVVKESVEEVMDEKINRIVEEIVNKKVEEKFKRESAKKVGSMATFKKNFQLEYGDYKQVSRKDLVRFVTNKEGVWDPRSIQSRIDYLLANEVIETFAQNVYNIKL